MNRALCTTTLLIALILVALPLHGEASKKDAKEQTPGIKVAVITNAGGAHLGAYFNALAKTAEATSVVLADAHGTAAEDARKVLGEKLTAIHQDRDRLLAEEKPDMALVSLEARLAPEAIAAALEAGCHVLAEKPACLSAEDFETLVVQAEGQERHLMLALANRLNPEIQQAKQLISDGALGQIYGVQLNLIEDQTRLTSKAYQDSWYADKRRAGGGHLTWLGIHWLDLAMYVTDASITSVTGYTGNVGGQPISIEDAVALSFRFDNNALGTLTSGYFLDTGYQSLLKVWGARGWLQIDSDAPRRIRWYSTASGEGATDQFEGESDHSAYTTFVRACVRASAGLQPPPITGRECLRVLRVVYGAYDAAETGVKVPVGG